MLCNHHQRNIGPSIIFLILSLPISDGSFLLPFESSKKCSLQQKIVTVCQLSDDSNRENEAVAPTLSEALNDIYSDEFKTPKASKKQKQKQQTSQHQRTKGEIKKLKYLMNQDVEKLIESNDPSAVKVAQDNIKRLQKLYVDEDNIDYKPRTLNYNMLVRALGRSKRGDAPNLAEKMLNQMIAKYKKTLDEDIKPNVVTYTEVIDAYARSKKRNAAEHAERILLSMMEQGDNDIGVLPTSITCDVVINAWARRRNNEGAQRAEHILERMEYLRTMGNVDVQPSTYSFATVISAWAKSKSHTEGAERAEYILARMIDFRKKIASSEGGEEYTKNLYPDTVVYNSCIDAWARSGDPRAATKAQAIFNEMEDEAQRGNAHVAPDAITYNTVINCYANSKHVSAAKAAERVLKRMENASDKEGRIAPNTRTYNQVLKCYATSKLPGSPQRADSILRYMLLSRNEEIQPDAISFCTCLDVWAKSKEPGKAEKSYELLQKLIKLYDVTMSERFKPSTMSYNTVLNCCAFSAFAKDNEKKKALSIAVSVFTELKQSTIVKPDAVSYGTLIKCISNLVPKGQVRNKMASDIFIKCTEEGLVNGLVFDEIKRAVPSNVTTKLLSKPIKSRRKKKPLTQWELRDLPRSWKENVTENKPKKRTSQLKKESPSKKKTVKEVKKSEEIPIRPFRRITEPSWQSGKDL
mmetsp:Transcript_25010/g.28937  ORF Transcript_25010/g.28937 Transcript_25010/m.28937 type:complete len:694 (-) Transcript_25010:22-2103(-)